MIVKEIDAYQSATPWPQNAVIEHRPRTFQDDVRDVVDEFMEKSRVMDRPEINAAIRMMAAELVSLRRELSWAEVRFEECLKERKV